MDKRTGKLRTMHNALHLSDEVDRFQVSRKEREREDLAALKIP